MHRIILYAILVLSAYGQQLLGYSNLTYNDPLPVYTAEYENDFLSVWERDFYRGLDDAPHQEQWSLTISPFRQTADSAKDFEDRRVFIGDRLGRWNMLGIFYPSNGNNLCTADPCGLLPLVGLSLFPTPTTIQTCPCQGVIHTCDIGMEHPVTCSEIINPILSDPNKQDGFFAIPVAYRKYGIRGQFDMRLFCDVGLRVQIGAADLTQTVTGFIDLTISTSGITLPSDCMGSDPSGCVGSVGSCKQMIVENIMDQKYTLAKALNLSIGNYHTTGFEDTYVTLFWQKLYPVNGACEGWPFFLWVPYITLEAILPTSKKVSPRCLFGLPLGNNGHVGYGFSAGMDFDFINSIEVGFQASMTRWTSHDYFNVPVPTNNLQSGMFPFSANFTKAPGTNWTFSMSMKAHYFLDRLCAYAQYKVSNHNQDCFYNVQVQPCCPNVTLPNPPPRVLVGKMSNESKWRVHVINFGLTYDIAPHISLGFLWQAPVGRRNAYRTGTLMISTIFRF